MMGNNNHKTSSASATHMGKEKKGKLWEIEANDAFWQNFDKRQWHLITVNPIFSA